MITAISNSNNVAFTGLRDRIAKSFSKKGSELGQQVTDSFEKSKKLEVPEGLTQSKSKSPLRYSDDNNMEIIESTSGDDVLKGFSTTGSVFSPLSTSVSS